ncbi:bZIP transcription factor bZIP-1 [Penicillium subrubescens]|uniref:bZIP transcription factor bZIP-1 n=1 Tax=Penicillium subrubescens TaxID=1316194 RepID=UPI002545BCDD|nr:bZIP transcription factor bZIP-1 [Penicillium subrubescens]KAJ5905743.1 bZIP transcription factor bZIP-1 [Penicillium subrubescens]
MGEANPDAPAPRKRGRPRTVTDDQQVPERRRTQLRVAQQAYRKRKEATITTLQSRVQELESGIEELSESFLSFSNLLFEAGIPQNHPRITSALQKLTQQCVSLAKNSSEQGSPAEAPLTTTRNLSTIQDIDPTYDPHMTQLDSLPITHETFQSSPKSFNQWPVSQQLPPTPPYQEQAILPFGIVLSSPNNPYPPRQSPTLNFPTNVSPKDLMKQERWTLSHRLVRQCCENAYRLLTRTPMEDPRIQEIFGKPLTIAERNSLTSGFYSAMHDENGDSIELKAKALSPLHMRTNSYSPEQLAISSRTWQLVIESGTDQWLDASGVQRLLQERGISIHDTMSPMSSPRSSSAPQLNVASFVTFLSTHGPVCIGRGPAFRKRDVESALSLAISGDPWDFTAVCEIP